MKVSPGVSLLFEIDPPAKPKSRQTGLAEEIDLPIALYEGKAMGMSLTPL
jgi:hypothetical protein